MASPDFEIENAQTPPLSESQAPAAKRPKKEKVHHPVDYPETPKEVSKSMMIPLGGLWKSQTVDKNENIWYSGRLTMTGARMVLLKNNRKKGGSPNQPDYNLCLSYRPLPKEDEGKDTATLTQWASSAGFVRREEEEPQPKKSAKRAKRKHSDEEDA